MINVICFLWGDWPDKGWGETYVRRLKLSVERNLSLPHRFICFTNQDIEGVECRPLNAPSWKGCLPKLYAYSPEADLQGRVLILDLDNVITGPLDKMAKYDGNLAVRAWFGGYPKHKIADGDMIGFEAGSDFTNEIWNRFSGDVENTEEWTGGRERYYLREFKPDLWQDILGERAILSYKRHLRHRGPPPIETSIVSFHDGGINGGNCRPHQLDEPWLKEVWV